MNYNDIIKTVSEIINNENIIKTGLTLEFKLTELNHRKLNEDLWIRTNPVTMHIDYDGLPFEVEIDGIIVRFVK